MATRSAPHVAVVLLVCAGLLITTPRMAGAAPIVFTSVVMNNGSCTPYVNCVITPGESDPGNIGVSGTGLVQLSGTFDGAFLSAAADAAAGLLRTSASASYNLADPGYRIAAAGAIVADTLTITAPGVADGTSGLLDVSITLDGTVTKSGTADAGTSRRCCRGGLRLLRAKRVNSSRRRRRRATSTRSTCRSRTATRSFSLCSCSRPPARSESVLTQPRVMRLKGRLPLWRLGLVQAVPISSTRSSFRGSSPRSMGIPSPTLSSPQIPARSTR